MNALARFVVSRLLALTVAVAMASSLAGCGSKVPSGPAPLTPDKPPLAASTEPTAAANYYFDGVWQSQVIRPKVPIVDWYISTDASPTASSAAAALAYMGRRYANQGRAMVLTIWMAPKNAAQVGHAPVGRTAYVFWNPTETTLTTGLIPPDRLGPHELVFYVSRGGFASMPKTLTVSDVTTETLTTDSPRQRDLFLKLWEAGLR